MRALRGPGLKGRSLRRAVSPPVKNCHSERSEEPAFLHGPVRVEYALQAYRMADSSACPASAAEVNAFDLTSVAKASTHIQPRSCTPEGVLHPNPASAFPGGAA
jgi:hypothetical protein